MIEHEKKLMLTKEEYTCLMEHYGSGKPVIKQTNYYFDTNDLVMNQNDVTCRIRLKDGIYTGTMKQHVPNTEDSKEIPVDVRDGICDNAFTDWGLRLQGVLSTERCIILKNAVCEAVLDQNHYLDHIDYELEIEYLPAGENDAYSIFQEVIHVLLGQNPAITAKDIEQRCKNTQSKSNRFFEKSIHGK